MGIKEYINILKYAEILHMTRFELAFCISYFILAIIISIYSIPGGSLFTTDSSGYIRDAENFLSLFPNYYSGPIYPALIAVVMGLGLTSEQSGSLIPILFYALLGFPLFLIGKIISRPMAGYITCIISLLCGKYLLIISTNIMTDMPGLFFSALVILFISIYNKYGILSSIAFAGLLASLSIFTRIISSVLIPAGIISIVLNHKKLKKDTLIALMHYSFIPITLIILRLITPAGYGKNLGGFSLFQPRESNLPLDLNVNLFIKYMSQIFYNDYKEIAAIIFAFILLIIIYMLLTRQILMFIKNTIHITSYILIYSIAVIVSTANTPISTSVYGFPVRMIVPIFPFISLLIVLLFISAYDTISNGLYKNIFKSISVVLLICLVAQGSNALYSQATDIRAESISQYSDRELLNIYISQNNITDLEKIYIDTSGYIWPRFAMALHSMRDPNHKLRWTTLISNDVPGKTIFDNLTSKSLYAGTLAKLIKGNYNLPIYMIVPYKVSKEYSKNFLKNIRLSAPYNFSTAVIYKVELRNLPSAFIISNSTSNIYKLNLGGDYMGLKHDQLLLLSSNPNGKQKDDYNLQILDFVKGSPAKVDVEYTERSGTTQTIVDRSDILLTGDFMGLGYDQALSIERDPKGDKLVIQDFSQGKAPAITRYSEAPAKNSALQNLTDADDALLAGDFLGRGYSQVLLIDRNPKGGKLVIADFSNGKAPEMTEFSEIGGNSTLLSLLLDDKDKQFSGDFMGLGHSQLMMINCNHTGAKEPKIIIADFSKGKKSTSLRYLENWGESTSGFGGWLDAADTQLVGNFMGLGHSQVLFVNHGHAGGKIMIADFSQGKPPVNIKYWESWNQGTIFQGWLDINDTRIAGDFKEFGYSQVLFLNNSIYGSNATIVDFINGKSMIAL